MRFNLTRLDLDNTGCHKRLPAGVVEPYLIRGNFLLPRIEVLDMAEDRGSRGAVVRVLVDGKDMVSGSTPPNRIVWRLRNAP